MKLLPFSGLFPWVDKFRYFCCQPRSHEIFHQRIFGHTRMCGYNYTCMGWALALFLYLRVLTIPSSHRVLFSLFFHGKLIANACITVHNTSSVQAPVRHAHAFRSCHELESLLKAISGFSRKFKPTKNNVSCMHTQNVDFLDWMNVRYDVK